MTKRIIYPNDDGGVSIIVPSNDCGISIEEVARKDVPAGKPYKIIDTIDVPTDRTFRAAWEADEAALTDGQGVGGPAWFIEQYTAEIAAINAEAMPARLPDDKQTPEEYDAIVAQWTASKDARIAQLNTQIATQQAEMQA